MLDTNHKTIFILDHTQYFSIPSENYIDLDCLKSKGTSSYAPTLSKSLWTCSVEGAIEYSRIVWDLFPKGKLIRFVVSDTTAHIINTWQTQTQNLHYILNAMSIVGVPQTHRHPGSDNSVIHGLKAAIESLFEPTEQQKELIKKGNTIQNKGRVVCLTSARDDGSMKSLEEIFLTVLMKQNEIVLKQQSELLPLDFCELVFINIYPRSMESFVSKKPATKVSPILSVEVHSCQAGDIPDKLTHLLLNHYDLASTTVTGIPMKEEQNANSSANYDVEILHPKSSHSVICASELLLPKSIKEGSDYETVTLKWCTPRGNGGELQPCLTMHRVTPVDVTSRPSSCLINFLLNGRSVLLEMPRQTGGKINSHLLSARGGEIFIHTLMVTRSCLEEHPAITEGEGGRVTDYRIQDFVQFAKNHKLFPLRQMNDHIRDENLLKARSKLFRHTRYFPLTTSSTIVYNLRNILDVFLQCVEKDEINDSQLMQCRQLIFGIMNSAVKQEQLPNLGIRGKSNRVRDDQQQRLLWMELELILQNSGKSPGHKALLKTVQECRSRTGNGESTIKTEEPNGRGALLRTSTDSPQSPPHSVDVPITKHRNSFSSSNGQQKSLFELFSSAEQRQSQKRLDFSGRLCTAPGQIAKLYPELGLKSSEPKEENKV